MGPFVRKLALTAHITSSVGWLGAVAGSLGLGVAGLASRDPQLVSAVYLTMELTGWTILVPFSLASMLTGLVVSLGTRWGLFRHYWVLVKLGLNVFAAIVLLLYMQTLGYLADLATRHGAVGVQAPGPDPVRPTQAGRAAPWRNNALTRQPDRRPDLEETRAGTGELRDHSERDLQRLQLRLDALDEGDGWGELRGTPVGDAATAWKRAAGEQRACLAQAQHAGLRERHQLRKQAARAGERVGPLREAFETLAGPERARISAELPEAKKHLAELQGQYYGHLHFQHIHPEALRRLDRLDREIAGAAWEMDLDRQGLDGIAVQRPASASPPALTPPAPVRHSRVFRRIAAIPVTFVRHGLTDPDLPANAAVAQL